MQSTALLSEERKDLIRLMKRESRPSRRLRMHVVLLAADGYSPTHISRVLSCSRTTVYALVDRFAKEGRAAFCDRKRRGPAPLLDDSTHERIETLVEEHSPTERGWLRSRWSCHLLVLRLFGERALLVSRETVRRALHCLNFRWRRPRPVPPSKDPQQKRERLQQILKRCCESGRHPSSRMRPSCRPIRESGSLGSAGEDEGGWLLRGPTAKCGSPEHSTSGRVASTG